MRRDFPPAVTVVSIGEIDREDRTYAVAPEWLPVGKLLASVRAVGFVAPILLERDDEARLRTVSGFRRLQVAQELKVSQVPCIILPRQSSRDHFLKALWENLACRQFTEVEKAIALQKMRTRFCFSESRLIDEFLPLFELRADHFHLERYLKIARLPERIQRAMTLEALHSDIGLLLSEWNENEQVFFIEIVSRYRLGRNKQKELMEVLGELKSIMKCQVYDPWAKSGARAIDQDERLSPQDRIVGIKSALRKLRYPRLTRHEGQFRKSLNSLRLPAGVRLSVPPYFEGSQVKLTVCADSPHKLRELISECGRLLGRGEVEEIFELL